MNIKCIVCGLRKGKADYFPAIVEVTKKDAKSGLHLEIAETRATDLGLDVYITAPEGEPLFEPFLNIVDWNTVPHISAWGVVW